MKIEVYIDDDIKLSEGLDLDTIETINPILKYLELETPDETISPSPLYIRKLQFSSTLTEETPYITCRIYLESEYPWRERE